MTDWDMVERLLREARQATFWRASLNATLAILEGFEDIDVAYFSTLVR